MADVMTEKAAARPGQTGELDALVIGAGFSGLYQLFCLRERLGLSVQVLGYGSLKGRVSHGRMVLVDRSVAVIGSMALSQVSLDRRREVAITVHDAANIARLAELFDNFARQVPRERLALSEFVRAGNEDEDE